MNVIGGTGELFNVFGITPGEDFTMPGFGTYQNDLNFSSMALTAQIQKPLSQLKTNVEGIKQATTKLGQGLSTGLNTADPAATPSGTNSPKITPWDKASDYFVRAIVVIVGFIFIAAGLSMFKTNSIVAQIAK